MYAAKEGHLWVVNSLLCSGALVDLQNNDGMTALGLASSEGRLEIIAQLLDNEACIDHPDRVRFSEILTLNQHRAGLPRFTLLH